MAEKVTPITTTKKGDGSVDAKKLKKFASRLGHARANVDEARGTYNEIFKEVEEAGIDRSAFKAALKLSRGDLLKAQAWIRDFDSYCHILGLLDQIDLLDGDKAAAAE